MPPGQGGKIIQIAVLLLIGEKPSHGYEIFERLEEFGIVFPDGVGQKGRIYRLLNVMESENLVEFEWDVSTSPPRKMYRLTSMGKEVLKAGAVWAQTRIEVLKKINDRIVNILDI